MASSYIKHTMVVVPLVLFLFFHPTSATRSPHQLFHHPHQLFHHLIHHHHHPHPQSHPSNMVDTICKGSDDHSFCVNTVSKLNPPTKLSDLNRFGITLARYSQEKSAASQHYIASLGKYNHDCLPSYDGMTAAFKMAAQSFAEKVYDTIDYDLHCASYDDFHCQSPQLTARNHEVLTLSGILSQIGNLLQQGHA